MSNLLSPHSKQPENKQVCYLPKEDWKMMIISLNRMMEHPNQASLLELVDSMINHSLFALYLFILMEALRYCIQFACKKCLEKNMKWVQMKDKRLCYG